MVGAELKAGEKELAVHAESAKQETAELHSPMAKAKRALEWKAKAELSRPRPRVGSARA